MRWGKNRVLFWDVAEVEEKEQMEEKEMEEKGGDV